MVHVFIVTGKGSPAYQRLIILLHGVVIAKTGRSGAHSDGGAGCAASGRCSPLMLPSAQATGSPDGWGMEEFLSSREEGKL